MPRSNLLSLAGWGNYPFETSPAYRPERLRDAVDVVRDAPETSLISRGLGRGYGDASLNGIPSTAEAVSAATGAVLLHERLARMLAFDAATGVLDAEAGVSIADVLETFVPRGWFPPVTPGTKYVTLGGAVAADVHGKNHHRDGAFSEFVESLALLTASGDVLTCSRTVNADAFRATVGGMGLTGAILSVRLRLSRVESAYIAVDYHRVANLDEALSSFGQADDRYQYSVAWIDCLASGASLGRSVLIRGNHAKAEELSRRRRRSPLTFKAKRKKSVPFNMPGWALNSWSVKAFNALFYKRHRTRSKIVDFDTFFYPLDGVHHWNRLYGRRGFVQYQALFPHDTARAGLVELLERLSASKRASFLAVLKTMGRASDGLLSFPFPGQTLALDLPNTGPDLLEFLRGLDDVVLKHGGRIYLAKDARAGAEAVARMYPQLDEFRRIKAAIDPTGRFSSSLSRRLNLAGTP